MDASFHSRLLIISLVVLLYGQAPTMLVYNASLIGNPCFLLVFKADKLIQEQRGRMPEEGDVEREQTHFIAEVGCC